MSKSAPPKNPDAAQARPGGRPQDAEREGERKRARHEEHDDDLRGGFERILPELIRRGLSVGKERVGESIFPRELTASLISHMGDIRSGVVKAVAQEVGNFLREADIAAEIRKVMAGLDVEAQVRLRFNQREDGSLQPEVEVETKSGDSKGD